MSFAKLLLLSLLTTLAQAEVITLVAKNRSVNSSQPSFSSETITLAEGDLANAHYVSNNAHIDVNTKGNLIRIDANDPDQQNLPVVAGPATIRLSNFSSLNAALATFTIKRANQPTITSNQAVVIPDDGSGDREVILESSTDMITWTPTQAGIFSSSNAARFFRVRIKKAPEE